MSTAYTYGVKNGDITEVKDYLLKCARGFGAFMHMEERDENDIVHREVNKHYLETIEEYKAKLTRFESMSEEELTKLVNADYKENLSYKTERLQNIMFERQRYMDMISKVQAWVPPTWEHRRLKVFALDQLESSMKFDCGSELVEEYKKLPQKESIEEYRKRNIDMCKEEIEYYIERYKKEEKACKEINQWIDDLIESF